MKSKEKNFVKKNLRENIEYIKEICDNSADMIINEFSICGVKCALVACDGMVGSLELAEMITKPLQAINIENADSCKIFEYIKNNTLLALDRPIAEDFDKIFNLLYSGFAVLLMDEQETAFAFGIQGYPSRGVEPSSGEGNITGGRDGFVENVRVNMSLIRRRMKTENLKFEFLKYGSKSKTDVFLVYMRDRVSEKLLANIKKSLEKVELETILSSGYLRPFLEGDSKSMFDTISTTERPDVLCSKILEGRIGIIIDGTPFVLVVPRLFNELFQTLDDYNYRPYYATFLRWLKYFGAIISVLLPGIYVAVAIHHPELLNRKLLVILSEAEKNSPFPLIFEALSTLIMYEVIREAGLRLPDRIGGAVSLIGGLIIGEAAVSSGFVSLPMLTIAAIAVISGLIIPDLNQSSTILRLLFVIVGGTWGLFGISLLGAFILFNLCASETYGYPLTAPISPFSLKSMRDVITRINFPTMQKDDFTIEKLQ
jgi:spore germination protein KA